MLRYVVFGAVAVSALLALCSWLVRTRRVSPFSALGRGMRTVTEPVIRPVERRIVRMGGNPTHAGGWLIVITAVLGIVVISFSGWLISTLETARHAAQGGPRSTFRLIVQLLYNILIFALVVRIIASWFGMFRYSKWVRPAYILTDWIVEPIRRIVPPLGAMDLSPLVAWFALWIGRNILMGMLAGG